MAGRNDAAIAAALEVVAQAVGQQPNGAAGDNGVRMLETFLRNHPPTLEWCENVGDNLESSDWSPSTRNEKSSVDEQGVVCLSEVWFA